MAPLFFSRRIYGHKRSWHILSLDYSPLCAMIKARWNIFWKPKIWNPISTCHSARRHIMKCWSYRHICSKSHTTMRTKISGLSYGEVTTMFQIGCTNFFFAGIQEPQTFKLLWKAKSMQRIKFFAWLLIMYKLNTKDMLQCRNSNVQYKELPEINSSLIVFLSSNAGTWLTSRLTFWISMTRF